MDNVRSALLAGFISSTIWMFITVAIDSSKSMVLWGGIGFLVGTALVTLLISNAMERSRT